jgi:hypothetical protein
MDRQRHDGRGKRRRKAETAFNRNIGTGERDGCEEGEYLRFHVKCFTPMSR